MKKMGGVLAGLAIFVVTLGALFYLFERHENSKKNETAAPVRKTIFLDHGTDFKTYVDAFLKAPEAVMQVVLSKGNHVIYDQVYKTDKNLLRVPLPENESASIHAIFAGCSYTWGEGLKDEETLPWFFQTNAKNVQAYNLGFPGGGVNTLLRYTELFDLKNITNKKNGFFIYTFMSNHFDRFFARYNFLSWAMKDMPYYEIEGKRPVYKGKIKGHSAYKKFHTARKAGLEHTLLRTQKTEEWSEREISDFTLAVKELERRYHDKFPQGQFVFIFHPDGGFGGDIRVAFKQQLDKLKIKYYDFDQTFYDFLKESNLTQMDMKIPDDGHPNQRMNKYLARILLETLKRDYQNLK